MARTPSTMLPLGTEAPDFTLPNPSGRQFSRDGVKGEKGLLVMFICPHCPFVKHVRAELARLGRHCQGVGIGVVAIMPNDIEKYPDDAPDKMAGEAVEAGYTFPYLHDATQETAKSYRAACTPDFFLFDGALRLAYRGQLDDSRPGNDVPVNGADLRAAIDALVSGSPVPEAQRPSLGCNIKWIPGKEPEYYGAQ